MTKKSVAIIGIGLLLLAGAGTLLYNSNKGDEQGVAIKLADDDSVIMFEWLTIDGKRYRYRDFEQMEAAEILDVINETVTKAENGWEMLLLFREIGLEQLAPVLDYEDYLAVMGRADYAPELKTFLLNMVDFYEEQTHGSRSTELEEMYKTVLWDTEVEERVRAYACNRIAEFTQQDVLKLQAILAEELAGDLQGQVARELEKMGHPIEE